MHEPSIHRLEMFWYRHDFVLRNTGWAILIATMVRVLVS